MKIVAVIPARFDSTRFPGKPLAKIKGRAMIEHVYERVEKADDIDEVIVATDDNRIKEKVKEFNGMVKKTSSEHSSGTDRVAEVAKNIDADLVVNVQGDEPLIEPAMIEQAIRPFKVEENILMSTLKKKIENINEINNPNVVKVVTDDEGYALYFSRATIPYQQNNNDENIDYFKHIGLYVYEREFLLKYSQMDATALEETESLEQLRALENGYDIKVVETAFNTVGVDTPQDLQYVEDIIEMKKRDMRWE